MVDRLLAPEFNKVENIEFGRAKKLQLNNNIPLHIINAGTQPVVRLEFILKAGSVNEPQPGIAYFASKILQEGTSKKSSKEISRSLDKYGAFLEINPGYDFSVISLYSLTKHLSAVLPIIQEILFEPSFPDDELELLKKIKIQNTRVNSEKTSYISSINFRKNIFGYNHPYGHELLEQEIQSVQVSHLKEFYNSNFFTQWDIIISGLITDKEVNEVASYFGKHSIITNEADTSIAATSNTGRFIISKDDSLQSSIRVGKLMLTKKHKDFPKLKVVNEILGGYFGSRLMQNIREEKGFTYGIHSNLVALKEEGYFIIGTDVKKEFTNQTLEEIYKEIKLLQKEPIGLQELETVKNYMTGSFLSEINTPFALADKFKGVYLNGLDYDYYNELFHTINTITPEEILDISQKYLQADSMTEVIAGGL